MSDTSNTPDRSMAAAEAGKTAAGRVIAFAGGKEGGGKTPLVVGLAAALQHSGRRSCLVDADGGLVGDESLNALPPQHVIGQALEGRRPLGEALAATSAGVAVLPSAAGPEWRHRPEASPLIRNIGRLSRELAADFDYVLLDGPAGFWPGLVPMVLSVQYVVLVVSPQQTAVTDTFSLVRGLVRAGFRGGIGVMVNRARHRDEALQLFRRFNAACVKHAHAHLHYLGYASHDPAPGGEGSVTTLATRLSQLFDDLSVTAVPAAADTADAPAAPPPPDHPVLAAVAELLADEELPREVYAQLAGLLDTSHQRRFGRPFLGGWRRAQAQLGALTEELARRGKQIGELERAAARVDQTLEELRRRLAGKPRRPRGDPD